jgi:3-phosphoshikimate 1-carboxyvinyltransferase
MQAKIQMINVHEVSGEPVADIAVESGALSAVEFGGGVMPRLIDEVPILVLAATQAKGTTVIAGAAELRVKESDRLKTITDELNKMGARIEERKDGLRIHGPTPLHGADTESYGDHRIAMTLAVAGLIAGGETRVRNVECVDTSFPGFRQMMERVRKD